MKRPSHVTALDRALDRALGLALGLTLGLVATACGPIVYVSDVTRHATASVEAARVAEADKYAPYYWVRAREYLHKARERAAYADYQGANRFGRLAAEAAELGEREALEARSRAPRPPAGSAPVAPAAGAP